MNKKEKQDKELTMITIGVMMDFFKYHGMEAAMLIRGDITEDSDFSMINTDDNSFEQTTSLFAEFVAREMGEAKDHVEMITGWGLAFKTLYLIVETMDEKDKMVVHETIKAIMRGEL